MSSFLSSNLSFCPMQSHSARACLQVAADAFETLAALLTTNKSTVFRFLNPEGDSASLAR